MNPAADALMAQIRKESDRRLDCAVVNLRSIRARHIPVIDESEPAEEAEIAWGKDLNTGEWCASIYFGDISESPFIGSEKEFDDE
jgi:hypothetical protein